MDQNTFLSPNEKTKAVETNPDLFCIHAKVLANKDGAPNPSRSWVIAIHLAVSSSHAPLWETDQNTFSTPNERTKAAETNQCLFSVHVQVPATKDRGPNTCCPLRNRNFAVCFVKQYHMVCKTDQNTSLTPNERTHPAQTNQDLFLVHAEWLANKDGASNPSPSWDNKFELSVSYSNVWWRHKEMDQHTCIAQLKRKDWHCWNPSRSLLYTCWSTHKKGQSSQFILPIELSQ